nr:cysteine--tRNA ligase [Vampirovibrio sp.]
MIDHSLSPEVQLYNTLTRNVERLEPIEAGKVRMYVCGPTVYDDAHLGHARCYITWDVLYRFLKLAGYDVTYARNVTDVDDKILARAKESGQAPDQVAAVNYDSFLADMAALNVLPPDQEPKATEYIDEMIVGIQALIDKGFAYAVEDGTVYYRVDRKSDYGCLSRKPLDDLQSGVRVEVDPHKENPLDFALWKGVEQNGDQQLAWKTPWGQGRPGWHMECSAMNHAIFGDQIDIHCGGADLIFPHHENEIAQSEAWTGKAPFSKVWMHNGFVNVSGEKMSKSLGNFDTIKQVLKGYQANTIRYFLLTNHYRMPVDFQEGALQAAENWVVKLHRTLKDMVDALGWNFQTVQGQLIHSHDGMMSAGNEFLPAFFAHMAADLNTSKALATINECLGRIHELMHQQQQAEPAFQENAVALISMLWHLGFDLAVVYKSKDLPVEPLRTIYKELTGQWLESDQAAEVYLD